MQDQPNGFHLLFSQAGNGPFSIILQITASYKTRLKKGFISFTQLLKGMIYKAILGCICG
jgi:hypothetical protein